MIFSYPYSFDFPYGWLGYEPYYCPYRAYPIPEDEEEEEEEFEEKDTEIDLDDEEE